MQSIAEATYAEMNNLSVWEIRDLRNQFEVDFPYGLDLIIPTDEYDRMVEEEVELLGPLSDWTLLNQTANIWALYGPLSRLMIVGGVMCHSVRLGFKNPADAARFKLKWCS